MIPRTVLAAQSVAQQLTPTEIEAYGNVILNGYAYENSAVTTTGAIGALDAVTLTSSGANFTDGTYTGVFLSSAKGSFAYATITVAGGAVTGVTVTSGGRGFVVGEYILISNLPSTVNPTTAIARVTQVNQYGVRPAMKGWSTNYAEYYTGLQPNAYGTNPGDSTGFNYTVRSYTPLTGPIASIGGNGTWVNGGLNYTPGIYTGIALSGGSGTGATATFTVSDIVEVDKGPILSYSVVQPGQGYGTAQPAPNPLTVTGIGFGATFAGAANTAAPYEMIISSIVDRGYDYSAYDYLEFPGGHKVMGTPSGSAINALIQVGLVGYTGVTTYVKLNNPGNGYKVGDVLTAALPGGFGLTLPVGAIVLGSNGGGAPRWAQPSRRYSGQGYSFIYPVADNPVPPPIGLL